MIILGLIVVNEMEKQAYSEKKIEKNPWLPDDKPAFSKVFCFPISKIFTFILFVRLWFPMNFFAQFAKTYLKMPS